MASTVDIFFSYSHKDESLRDELATHLKLLERAGVIRSWHDRCVGAGEEWRSAIDEHLENAHIFLLLVSADFLASDYCYDVEMKRALERHDAAEATVLPIILRCCGWDRAPFAKLQPLPKDAIPVTSWKNRDEAWMNVVDGIEEAVTRYAGSSLALHTPSHTTRSGILNAQAAQQLDENDQLSMLESWLRSRTWNENLRVIVFAKIDMELGLPEGATKRLIEQAASRLGYEVDRRGATTILLKARARTPSPPPPRRGWSPSRDGFGGF